MPEIKINSVTMSYAKEKSLDSINAVIGEGAKVTRCIVADNVEISPGAVVGHKDSEHIELIAKKRVK